MDEEIFKLEDLNIDDTFINPEKPTPKFKVKITCSQLRRRRAPNLQAEVVSIINDQGIYDIYNEVNGWGQLDDGNWIMLSYTQIIE